MRLTDLTLSLEDLCPALPSEGQVLYTEESQ